MKNLASISAALLSIIVVAVGFGLCSNDRAQATPLPQEPQKPAAASQQPPGNSNASDPESQYSSSFAYLAWSLFLQAVAPTDGALTFETWTEQCELNPKIIGCP